MKRLPIARLFMLLYVAAMFADVAPGGCRQKAKAEVASADLVVVESATEVAQISRRSE